jgi:large subunit ribosomal protein L15
MQINQLQRVHKNKKRMIVARGGRRGKTSGRGGKGQSARAGNKRRPEWRDIIKKIPKLRGRGVNSNKSFQELNTIVSVATLEAVFSAGDKITPTTLVEKGVISTYSGYNPDVKILGDGEITKALNISGCRISDSAKAKIEKAGGTIEIIKGLVKKEIRKQVVPVKSEPVKKENKKEVTSEKKVKSKKEAK